MVDGRSIPSVFLQQQRASLLFQIHGLFTTDPSITLSEFGISRLPQNGKSEMGEDAVLMNNGPGMWLFESRERPQASTLQRLRQIIAGSDVTVTNISAARIRVQVSGERARDFLKKGCPIDINAMQVGDVATTLIGHLGTTIHCRPNQFVLFVQQSFGEDFWQWCRLNAREFNI